MAGNDGSFFTELKRRNVYRVGIAYAIASWLVLQVIDVVEPIIGVPEWVPKLILVLLALGLPLVLIFAWAYEMTPDGLRRASAIDPTQSITPETGRRLDRMIIGVLIVAVAVMAIDQYVLDSRTGPAPMEEEPATAAEGDSQTGSAPAGELTTTEAPSIAVLPFMNMSADESSTYFSDGLADTLLHMLAQIREIRVAARTSSFQFRDQNTDITQIAEALNVGTVLEGSVQKAGNKIRITAQLIEAETGYHLWSGNFDRDLDDVFAIQDEIATEVVAALKVSLLGESAEKLTQHGTDNVEAYTEFLLGINDLNEYTFESLPRAEQHFRKAIELDPDYALAWAQLGNTYITMLGTGIGRRTDMVERAKQAADRALAIDPEMAMAIAVLGDAEEETGNVDLAEELYLRAMQLSPNDTTVSGSYAWLLIMQNRGDESLEILQRALTVDPLSTQIHNVMALHYRFARQYEDGLEITERLRDIAPTSPLPYYRAAEIEFARGNWAQATVLTRQAFELDPDDPELALMIGEYYLAMEMRDEAENWFDRAVEIDAGHPVSRAVPLLLHIYDGTAVTDGIGPARQYILDQLDTRQGSRNVALDVIWLDAVANDTMDDALALLRDQFPELFNPDANHDAVDNGTRWYAAAMMIAAGDRESGRALIEPMLERSTEFSGKHGTFSRHLWNLVAIQDRDAALSAMRELVETGHMSTRWSTFVEHSPVFDFVRDTAEYKAYIEYARSHAAEQREALRKLLGEASRTGSAPT